MSRSALVLVLVLVMAMTMNGCALYVRPISTLSPDDHVVLELNDQGIPDMAHKLGSGTFLVGGRLQKMDSTSLVMSVYQTQSTHALLDQPDTFRYPRYVQWGGEAMTIPKFDVASARVQRVSGPFVAVAALAAVALGVSTAEFVSFSHHKPPTLPALSPPPALRIALP